MLPTLPNCRYPKVLIVTTYVDELQLSKCKQSVKSQLFITATHYVVSGLDFLSSQRHTLYLFDTFKSKYDYVLKLDADMILLRPDVISNMILKLEKLSVDRLSAHVYDYYTASNIFGIHLLRAASVPSYDTDLVSLPQADKCISLINPHFIYTPFLPIVSHGYKASVSQALRFGFNRGRKLLYYKKGIILLSTLFTLHFLSRLYPHEVYKHSYHGYLFAIAGHSSIDSFVVDVDYSPPSFLGLIFFLHSKQIALNLLSFVISIRNLISYIVFSRFYLS